MKIDFKVDTATRNYDAHKGHILAETADGNKPSSSQAKNEHPSFDSGRMDKVSFVSSIAVKNPPYALGVMLDKEMHLVPVKTFYQMRQTYSYFDKGDKRTKAEQKTESDEEMEDMMKVTVTCGRLGDAEKKKKARERSYHYISNIGADEPWCETLIYPKHTPQSQIERQKIPLAHHIDDEHFTSVPSQDYFSDLIGDETTLNAAIPVTDETAEESAKPKTITLRGPISKKQVKKLPLLEQIKVFLKDGEFVISHPQNSLTA